MKSAILEAFLLVDVAFVALSAGVASAQSCAELRQYIDSLLTSDDCRTSDDCLSLTLPEPWGCDSVVNGQTFDEVERAYNYYNGQCGPFIFSCLAHPLSLRCRHGQCEARKSLRDRFPDNSARDANGRPIDR